MFSRVLFASLEGVIEARIRLGRVSMRIGHIILFDSIARLSVSVFSDLTLVKIRALLSVSARLQAECLDVGFEISF